MSALTGNNVKDTYQGLLKLADSATGITSTLQYVQDGLGNNIPLQASNTTINFTGNLLLNGSPITGQTGSSGTSGTSGTSGQAGSSGTSGTSGSSGSSGTSGATGASGSSGTSGTSGSSGSSGTSGASGANGSSGTSGTSGQAGASGSSGTSGTSGQAGSSGTSGQAGSSGTSGTSGTSGDSIFAQTGSFWNTTRNIGITGSLDVTSNVNVGISGSSVGSLNVQDAIVAGYEVDTPRLFVNSIRPLTGADINVTGSLIIDGNISATSASFTYVNTVYETASVIYSSGSNQFGDASNDTQTLWGTVNLPSGPLVVTGSVTATNFTGSLEGTASYAVNSLSASYAINADTASIARDVIVVGKCDNLGGLTKGTVVRITGANGDNPLFDSASWSDEASSANVLGMLSEDVAYNGFANIIVLGKVLGLNTNAYPASTLLYLSSSGQYTSTVPTAPSQSVRLGQVLRQSATVGSMYFRADNGYELGELHNVIDTATTTGELLSYVSGAYGLWQNKSFSQLGLATTGSNTFKGNQIITGSLDIRSGSLDLFSNNTTVNTDLYLTNSLAGQSNIIRGWNDNPTAGGSGAVQANYTGSLRITGSNNIVSMPQIRATGLNGGSDQQGYISGSGNIVMGNNAGIYLNTGSLLFPKIQSNILGYGGAILMNFTTSSLAGGHPTVGNNLLMGSTITLNHNSGSITNLATNAILGGTITSTQNFVTNARPNISQNNVIGQVTLNHLSSSINYTSNYNNATVTVNNAVSSSITNNLLTVSNNTFLGASHNIFTSGSQSSNIPRQIQNNLIGGANINISSSFVSSSNSNLYSTIAYGNALTVSGSHTTGTLGGSAFVGRFNGLGGLEYAQDIVFAVGTGTGTSNRRTGFWIDSGSVSNVSGSLNVTGSFGITGSASINGYVQGNVNSLSVTSNTASLNLNNGNFFQLALTGSQDIRIEPSNIKAGQTINMILFTTGSGTVSFPTTVKQASGSAYVPTTGTGTDIITLVSFDSSNVYLANIKNLV